MHYSAHCMLLHLFQCKVVKKKKGYLLSQISPSPLTSSFPPPLCSSSEFHGIQGTLLPPSVAVHWYRTFWSGEMRAVGGAGGVCSQEKPVHSAGATAALWESARIHTDQRRGNWEEKKGDQRVLREGQKATLVQLIPTLIQLRLIRLHRKRKLTAKTKLRTRPVPHFKSFWSTVSEN